MSDEMEFRTELDGTLPKEERILENVDLLRVCAKLDLMFGADKGTAEGKVFCRLKGRNPTAATTEDHLLNVWTVRKTTETSAVIRRESRDRTDGVMVTASRYNDIDKVTGTSRKKIGFSVNLPKRFVAGRSKAGRPSRKLRRLKSDMEEWK